MFSDELLLSGKKKTLNIESAGIRSKHSTLVSITVKNNFATVKSFKTKILGSKLSEESPLGSSRLKNSTLDSNTVEQKLLQTSRSKNSHFGSNRLKHSTALSNTVKHIISSVESVETLPVWVALSKYSTLESKHSQTHFSFY